ncbi:M2 family metallopeptidase [Hyphobacterium sp. CCMP332]|nr:M2 family metallopeptidase [Hyphobacterium sp. CCMP332]
MRNLVIIFIAVFLFSCEFQKEEQNNVKEEAQAFLDAYTAEFVDLYYASSEAQWKANTMIIEGDTEIQKAVNAADEALAEFTGKKENIEKARKYLEIQDQLEPLQVKQFESILYMAANNPATVSDLVKKRIAAENAQNEKLFGFDFQIDGRSLSTNEIDNILKTENSVEKRLKAWECSKEVGKELKIGLKELRNLRNQTVQALGYDDYFTYQVSDYGMTVKEMMQMNKQLISDVWPLYRELHTYMRYELADKFGRDVPVMLPAHWLPNRWGQDWSAEVEVDGIDLDGILEEKGSQWLVEQSERFYVSMGFDSLPQSFYELSDLYPLAADANHKKNNHASAWHMDLKNDVRSLMSVEPNAEWYETTHHELGHIYYYMEYSNPNVPILLREGANRAYHEAIGSMLGLAAMQKPFLENLDLVPEGVETDETKTLLKEALNYIVFIPFSAGTMTHFEHDLYVDSIPETEFNERWWEYVNTFQGITAPNERGEDYCDAASKTHINNDAAQYYDYALSYVLLFQFHNHIAENILKQDPRATNYYGNTEVGNFLHEVLSPGATRDWRDLLKQTTGEDINAKAMLNYFAPLMDYLKEVNHGREHTLPETV